MSMNINADDGDKVIYANPNNGMPYDQKKAKKHLQVGEVYIVDYTLSGDYSSKVCLKEVDGVWFNTVMFEDVKQK